MKGQSIQEFMDDIMSSRLVEKEFFYKGEEFMFVCDKNNDDLYSIIITSYSNENHDITIKDKSLVGLYRKFENLKIIDGKTIYELDEDIEVSCIFHN